MSTRTAAANYVQVSGPSVKLSLVVGGTGVPRVTWLVGYRQGYDDSGYTNGVVDRQRHDPDILITTSLNDVAGGVLWTVAFSPCGNYGYSGGGG